MFEDLDDRRVPLWMLMGNYSLGSWGPASSLTVEGFWVPGPLDAHVAPWAPPGTPYEVPLAHMIYRLLRVHTPDRNMSDSRWGVRLQGLIRNQINVTVAHMKTFPDVLTTHTVVTPDLPLLVDANDVYLEGVYRPFHITGGSMSFFEPHTNAVFRSEVA